uniref:IS1 family transposase n=1 Tax=Candidatus Bandiella numerosa TaxID=2570586 RepID=UPI0034DF2971
KKKRKLWIWLAYSRARKRIIACEVGSRSVKTLKKLWQKGSLFKPDIVCTDNYKAYARVIPNDLLIQSKKHTYNIEAQNSWL